MPTRRRNISVAPWPPALPIRGRPRLIARASGAASRPTVCRGDIRALAARLVGTPRRGPRALARALPPDAGDPTPRDRAAIAWDAVGRPIPDDRAEGAARRLDARRWFRAGAAGQFRRYPGVPRRAG